MGRYGRQWSTKTKKSADSLGRQRLPKLRSPSDSEGQMGRFGRPWLPKLRNQLIRRAEWGGWYIKVLKIKK